MFISYPRLEQSVLLLLFLSIFSLGGRRSGPESLLFWDWQLSALRYCPSYPAGDLLVHPEGRWATSLRKHPLSKLWDYDAEEDGVAVRVTGWSTVAFQGQSVSWTNMKKDFIQSKDFSRSLVQSSPPSKVTRLLWDFWSWKPQDISCTASLANLDQCTAILRVQKSVFESSLCLWLLPIPSVFPLCTAVVRMPPLLGNLKGTEGLLLDASGAVLSSGLTCLDPSTSPQRAGAQILTNLVVLCWTHVLGDPKSVYSIPNAI